MTEEEDIKNFTISFFANLNAAVLWDSSGKKLRVLNVPESFEKFYGKKSPYDLVFKTEDMQNGEEPMIKGSFLLNCMKEFLSDKGQTTLVKIDFDSSSEEDIHKCLHFRNCQLSNFIRKPAYDWLVRFTFLTTLQYLNEKEQIMNPIYVKGGEIVKFNLGQYKTLDGKKEEIKIEDIKSQYNAAKSFLKSQIQPKIESISEGLDKRLEKELQRVRNHYLNQIEEDGLNLEKSERQAKELENQMSNSEANKTLDMDFAKIRLSRLKETIASLKSEKRMGDIKKEKEFFLKDEENKHSLNVNNQVMNTTIIYFPINSYSGYLKNHDTTRLFNFVYNPLTGEVSKVLCEVCSKEIKDICLCTGGHISCGGCLRACLECQSEYCTKCLSNSCFTCGKKICKKCAKRCPLCGKIKCKSHMSGLSACNSCMEKTRASSLKRANFRI